MVAPAEPTLDPVVIEELRQLPAPGGGTTLDELAEIMRRDLPERLAELAAAGRDGEAVRRAAHKLSGSAGVLGATRLWRAAQRLERSARAQEVEQFAPLLAQLTVEVEQTLAALALLVPP